MEPAMVRHPCRVPQVTCNKGNRHSLALPSTLDTANDSAFKGLSCNPLWPPHKPQKRHGLSQLVSVSVSATQSHSPLLVLQHPVCCPFMIFNLLSTQPASPTGHWVVTATSKLLSHSSLSALSHLHLHGAPSLY